MVTDQQEVTQVMGSQVQVAAGGIPTTIDREGRPSRWRRIRVWTLRLLAVAILLPVIQVALLRVIDPPFTAMMVFQSFEHLFAGESPFWSHDNVDRTDISRHMLAALVAAEDQRFWQHNGFDFKAIEQAQRDHARRPKKPMRGASTITQQVAKNVFLPPWRSFIRKGVEAYYTVLIEFMWPKERILEMYANIAEFAPGVYGVEEGAAFHFKKTADQLSPQQAALMAAVLPNPKRWKASKPSPYIRRRAARIQRQMYGIPTTDEEEGEPD